MTIPSGAEMPGWLAEWWEASLRADPSCTRRIWRPPGSVEWGIRRTPNAEGEIPPREVCLPCREESHLRTTIPISYVELNI